MLRSKQCQDPTWIFSFEFHQVTLTFSSFCPGGNVDRWAKMDRTPVMMFQGNHDVVSYLGTT